MYEALRHPKRNAAILGLLQGIPQGLSIPEQKQFIGLDHNLWLLTCFGLFIPPLLIALTHFMNRRPHRWWMKVTEYLDPYLLVFWGCLSLAICGAYSLWRAGATEGYGMVAYFGSGAIGFLVGSYLDRWLKVREARNAI